MFVNSFFFCSGNTYHVRVGATLAVARGSLHGELQSPLAMALLWWYNGLIRGSRCKSCTSPSPYGAFSEHPHPGAASRGQVIGLIRTFDISSLILASLNRIRMRSSPRWATAHRRRRPFLMRFIPGEFSGHYIKRPYR